MAKPYLQFSTPIIEALGEQDGWTCHNEKHTRFSCARFHFSIFRRSVHSEKIFGEPLDRLAPVSGVKSGVKYITEYTLTVAETIRGVETALIEVGFLQAISTELSQVLGVPKVLEFGSKISTSWQHSYKEQFSKTLETSRTNTRSEKLSYEQTFEFEPESQPKEYLVLPQYYRTQYDLHLTHLDYLQVEYTREWSGLRKRRRKAPKFEQNRPPSNILTLNIPLAGITTWEPYKTVVVRQVEDQIALFSTPAMDPRDITVGPPQAPTPHVTPVLRPSLYHLSNAAFPLKWVKIKGPWTEDDLKAAEMDEALSEKGVWFFQHGPGHKQSRV